jgi:hypothetical protein
MKEETMTPTSPDIRELAAREGNGVRVVLHWHARRNAVTVLVEDISLGDRFVLDVPADRALDAFYHPYAVAARR